jgi:anthranilate synthase component 2
MKKILLLDNFDSFTFNLVHLVEQFEEVEVHVFRNDEIALTQVEEFDKIILSPGPGLPEKAGIMMDLIYEYASSKPIFGVCLGHQAIAQAFGAKLFNLETVQHGVSTKTFVIDPSELLFQNMPPAFNAGRYHSWMVDRNHFPSCFKVTSIDEQGNIMSIRHETFNLCGVQFHPESVLTEYGKTLISNWLNN